MAGDHVAEQQRVDARGVGHDQPPGGQRVRVLAGAEAVARDASSRIPRPPASTRSASSAHTGTPVSISAISSASSSSVARAKPALQQPPHRGLLARDPVDVGVEPDLAEEGPVGVRDRLGAHRDHARAAVAVGQRLQAPPQLARAGPLAARHRHPVEPQPRELGAELGLDEPRRRAELELVLGHHPATQRCAPAAASAAGASQCSPISRCATIPPRLASSTIGQTATP